MSQSGKLIQEQPGLGVSWPLDSSGRISPLVLPDGRKVSMDVLDAVEAGFTPEAYGARFNGTTDDLVAIQAAEDAASSYASAIGAPVILRFPDSGVAVISNYINKKSGTKWVGGAKIKRINNATPTGVNFSLVRGDNVHDWAIDGLSFEGVPRDVSLAQGLTESIGLGSYGGAIEVQFCTRWEVTNCVMSKVSRGILFEGCRSFRVTKNRITSDCGKTVASILDGTYTNLASYTNTGGILGTAASGSAASGSGEFIISENYVSVPGLDIGIEPLLLSFDTARSVVANNMVVGANAGIQLYRGSYPDPGGTVNYTTDTVVTGNLVYATWEQGIYIRQVTGAMVANNVLIDVAKNVGGAGGSSSGGIVTRINPGESVGFTGSRIPPLMILDNYILNPGRNNVVFDGGIQVRGAHVIVRGNAIVRDETKFTTSLGAGIVMGQGDKVNIATIESNFIYNFADGINHAAGGYQTQTAGSVRLLIKGNQIEKMTGNGMILDSYTVNSLRVIENVIKTCATGLAVKRSPGAKIIGNEITDCTIGIDLKSGCLASNYVEFRSANTYTTDAISVAGGRIGGTLVVQNNAIDRCTTPHTVSETSPGDISFHGRCAVWSGDIVNGRPLRADEFSGATPPTNSPRTWNKGEVVYNSTIAGATLHAKICSVGGSYAANSVTISATGDTTNGSAVLTNLSAMRGIGPGMYLAVGGSTKMVVDMDPAAATITFDSNFGSTATGVAVSLAAPTFIDLVTAGAT